MLPKTGLGTEVTSWSGWNPDIALRVAVLRQAIRDHGLGGELGENALAWISGHLDSCAGFSFEEICDSLDFDAREARSRILEVDDGEN
jgi:hypothetical protein